MSIRDKAEKEQELAFLDSVDVSFLRAYGREFPFPDLPKQREEAEDYIAFIDGQISSCKATIRDLVADGRRRGFLNLDQQIEFLSMASVNRVALSYSVSYGW
jgi:hypothetical protein